MSRPSLFRRPLRPAALALAVAGLAYLASLAVLAREPDFSVVEPLFLLVVLGVAYPLLAWALTRRPGRATPLPERDGDARLGGLLLYMAAFALVVLGWGFSALQAAVPDEPMQSLAQLAVKLATMVVLPVGLFLSWRLGARAALPAWRLWLAFAVMAVAYLALQSVFGRGLSTLAELAPSTAMLAWAIPLCYLWQTLEAGFCEEVLFRRVLQERIAAATRSHVAAVAWTCLLFGLAHAPGLWMRGGHLMEGVDHATPGWALAYSIVMVAPAGIVFGVLWARTRSLWLIVCLHGMVDLVPQLAPFIRAWTGQ